MFVKTDTLQEFIPKYVQEYVTSQLQTVVIFLLFYLIGQKMFSFLILRVVCLFKRQTLRNLSVAIVFMNSVYKTSIYLQDSTSIFISKIKLSRKRIDELARKTMVLDFQDCDINISEQFMERVLVKEERDTAPSKKEITLEVSLASYLKNERVIKCIVSWVLPFQLSIQKIHITLHGKEYYIDYATAKLSFDVETKKIKFNVFIHDFMDYRDTCLQHLEFNFSTYYKLVDNGQRVFFHRWHSSVRLSDLTASLTQSSLFANRSTHATPESKTEKLTLLEITKKYKRIVSTLNALDFKLENINISFPEYDAKFHCSNFIFRIKSLSPLADDCKFEVTLSSNSLHVEVLKQKVIVIPLMNVFSTSDHLLTSDSNIINCTVGLVDSTVAFSYKHVEYYFDHFARKDKKKKTARGVLFAGLQIPKYNIKFILPNFALKYLAKDENWFVWKNNEIAAHFQHSYFSTNMLANNSCEASLVRINQPTVEKLSSSSFVKIAGSSLTFKSKSIELPVVSMHKLEIYKSNEMCSVVNVIVKGLHFTLNHLSLLTSISSSVLDIKSLTESIPNNAAHANMQAPPVSKQLEIKSQFIECSFMTCIGDFIPAEMSTDDGFCKTSYGLSVYFDNFYVHSKKGYVKADFDNIFLNKVVSVNEFEASQSFAGRVQNIAFIKQQDSASCLQIPQLKIVLDVQLVWICFYLKTIYHQVASQHVGGKKKSPTSQETAPLQLSLGVTLVEANLVDNLKLLFTFYKIKFSGSVLTFRKFHVLTPSVYVPKQADTIYVRLFRIDNFRFCKVEDTIDIETKVFQLRTEYHLRFYTIVDRLVTTVKAFKQIMVAFKTLPRFEHLEPVDEEPKHVPKIRIRSRKFIIKVDEDPFEHDLGLIFRVGLLEQRIRMQKMMFFEEQTVGGGCETPEELLAIYRNKLYENFSTSWIQTVKKARKMFTTVGAYDLAEKNILGNKIKTLFGHEKTALFSLTLTNLDWTLQEPNFGINNYADFMWEYGKGVPKDTKYTTLIPMSMSLCTYSFDLQLRDYLVPILSLSGMHLLGDFCFAEQSALYKSRRSVWVPFLSESQEEQERNTIFGSHVIRTLNSVKTFMNININLDSKYPSTITWGKSLQPGYQSIMLWFDYFTKPPLDPSEKVGFWDKFRLLVHGKIVWNWTPRSELHLNIKGSSNPYKFHDGGAGMTFCWNKGTQMIMHGTSDPKDLLVIQSKGFILGVQDFINYSKSSKFSKVMMQLSGDVTWKAGLLFEAGSLAKAGEEPRTTNFREHYKIDLVNPIYVPKGFQHDSYAGFRSDFIHMSIGVYSDNKTISKNTAHFAPSTSHHFFKWWHLFNTYTSGPIRQGPLFSSLTQNSKKFGSSLFTIKYSLSLAPLEISHIYRHPHSTSQGETKVEFTGMKAKFDSLKFDLHQKKLKVLLTDEKLQRTKNIWMLKIDQGEVDCVNTDMRLMVAEFNQKTGVVKQDYDRRLKRALDNSDDKHWFNCKDFIDLEDFQLATNLPKTFYTIPLMHSPRISYFRNIDRKVHSFKYPFGHEDSHDCIYGKNKPEATQKSICIARANQLQTEITKFQASLDSLKKATGTSDDYYNQIENLASNLIRLKQSKGVVLELIKDIDLAASNVPIDEIPSHGSNDNLSIVRSATIDSIKQLKVESSAAAVNSFDNRFILHNILLKVNEKTKYLLINYMSKIADRKSSAYYISHKSLSIVNEMLKWSEAEVEDHSKPNFDQSTPLDISNTEFIRRFEELIREVDDSNFQCFDNILLKLILPQIQVTSTVEKEWALMVSSKDIEVGIIDVIQDDGLNNSVISSVEAMRETRYCTLLSDANFFVLNKETVLKNDLFNIGHFGYGSSESGSNWPPWLPIESCHDPELVGSYSILKKTDICCMFKKPNTLFFDKLSHSIYDVDPVLKIGFPELHLTSNAVQYNAIYNIIEDIMNFGSAVDKKLDNLTKTILADELKSNFKMSFAFILGLQNKIRDIVYQRGQLKVNDPDTYVALRSSISQELQSTRFELTLIMSALKKNYARMKGLKHSTKLLWFISADDIIWEMYEDNTAPFITFGLGYSIFQRTDDSDGANTNKISVSSLHCFNLQTSPIYVDLLAPYQKGSEPSHAPMLEVMWFLGTPVGGISDLEDLVIRWSPIKFQMDHKTMNKILDFLFKARDTGSSRDDASSSDTVSVAASGQSTSAGLKSYLADKLTPNNDSDESLVRVKTIGSWDFDTYATASEINSKLRLSDPPTKSMVSTSEGIQEMVKRSSKYINIKSLTVKSMTVCVSYRGSRSVITNVDNLIVNVPTIKYENKVWSTDEFISSFKKDIIKVVLHHTGTIIGNKFKPKKKTESKYESFKQFSKFLKNDIKTYVSDPDEKKQAHDVAKPANFIDAISEEGEEKEGDLS